MFLDEISNAKDLANVGDSVSGSLKTLLMLFPGISLRSVDNAQSRVTKNMLKDIEKVKASAEERGYSRELTESLIEDVKTRHRRIANIASVVSFAEPEVNRDTDGSAEIDFDWIELFKSYAERTSSKDVQVIWGKLLAGELNHPGSYSKLAMWTLFNMSEKNAHDFAALASMCVHHCDKNGVAYGEPLLILDSDSQPDSDTFNGGAISIRDVNMLASLGLVDTSSMRTLSFDPGQRQLFRGAEFMVEVTNGSDMQIDLVLLPIITCAGLELLELSSIGTFQSLLEYFVRKIEAAGLSVLKTRPLTI